MILTQAFEAPNDLWNTELNGSQVEVLAGETKCSVMRLKNVIITGDP